LARRTGLIGDIDDNLHLLKVQAILDADGTLVPSDAECKQGMDFTYDGQYGYHPLLISLANTAEPLFLVNRSGNRPSSELADVFLDKAVKHCLETGFRTILLRGDTDFSQTKHLDRWDAAGNIRFIFGFDSRPTLKARADELPAEAYSVLSRPVRRRKKTEPRQSPSESDQKLPESEGSRRFTCSRRWLRSLSTSQWPARRVIA
jgi:Transposase DDE domain group 1